MSASAYSQNVWPRAVLVEGDTIVEITTAQMDSALVCFDYLEEARVIADTLAAANKQARNVNDLLGCKIEALVEDSTQQAKANAILVKQNEDKDKQITTLQNKSKGASILVYISSGLAVVFAIFAAAR